jgi:hypothetical protein
MVPKLRILFEVILCGLSLFLVWNNFHLRATLATRPQPPRIVEKIVLANEDQKEELLKRSAMYAAGMDELVFTAKDKAQIEASYKARTDFGKITLHELQAEGETLLVGLRDTCSGVHCEEIHIFIREREEWRLCVYHRTRTKVSWTQRGKELVFSDADGAVLLTQPIATLRLLNR